jgi:predicted metal-dependent hydrolase
MGDPHRTSGLHGLSGAAPPVEIRVSSRRRKTASAYWREGRVVVLLPAHVRGAERDELVDWLVRRTLERHRRPVVSDAELAARAERLADRYLDGIRPRSIRWVDNQHARWGSCTAGTGDIRLSDRLVTMPAWVLDARQREASAYLRGFAHGLGAERS